MLGGRLNWPLNREIMQGLESGLLDRISHKTTKTQGRIAVHNIRVNGTAHCRMSTQHHSLLFATLLEVQICLFLPSHEQACGLWGWFLMSLQGGSVTLLLYPFSPFKSQSGSSLNAAPVNKAVFMQTKMSEKFAKCVEL